MSPLGCPTRRAVIQSREGYVSGSPQSARSQRIAKTWAGDPHSDYRHQVSRGGPRATPHMWRAIFSIFILIYVAGAAGAEDCAASAVGYKVMQVAGRVTAVWYPTTAPITQYAYSSNFSGLVALNAQASKVCGRAVPLVVFSHGDLGCGLQSISFTEELARRGYVVAAPDHADAFLCHIAKVPSVPSHRAAQPNFLAPDTWTDATFRDRRNDIAATINAVLSNSDFQPVIDSQNIGAAGHSLGGYTVVGMAGGWTSWVDSRIRAVLALSPYVMPFQVRQTLGSVHVPLMYQGGTLDVGITPFLTGANGAYSQANSPAYLVELKRAGHFAWVNCGNAHTTASCLATQSNARLIDKFGIAFFDRYLKRETDPILEERNPELAAYEFKL
jgi:predicted dienelactone hydrolase